MPSAIALDRKSTRLNSSHGYISYAVFCLKKKIGLSVTANIIAAIKIAKHLELVASDAIITVAADGALFFFNDPATTEIYPLPLHDALPISLRAAQPQGRTPRSSQSRARRLAARGAAK